MAPTDDSRLHEMALGIHRDGSFEETIQALLGFAQSALQCTHAALILQGRRGQLELVGSTDPILADLEAVQQDVGAGPDLDLAKDRLGVLVTDTRLEHRWPQWAKEADAAGLRSMLGARLYTERGTVGTLTLYDVHESHFDVGDQAVANVLAGHAAIALTRSRHLDNLWQAIDARKRIGQAQGILMARYGLDEDQAFQLMLRYSQNENRKLRLVAEEIVQARELPAHAARPRPPRDR